MIGHKPECPANWGVGEMPERPCTFCEMLSACEQRVANEIWGAIREGSQYKSGFEGGLDAAREAVEALDIGRDVRFSVDVKADALAVIDALRQQ